MGESWRRGGGWAWPASGGSGGPVMVGGSSELLIDPSAELRKRKLIELSKQRPRAVPRTCRQRASFYATSFFVLAAVCAGSCILFLVPLYVDPAISTLVADFVPQPVLCTTLRKEDHSGIFNCTWSSCREGCTSDMYRCTHIYVNYTPYGNDTELEGEAILLVNIKGCGYPPDVNCSNFTAEYGKESAVFPCHYSRQNRTIVMRHYDRDRQVEIIINYFAIPFVITVVTSVVLCVMHCDCRRTPPPVVRRTRIHDQR